MKAYICDLCGERVPPTQYDTPPKGWYTVTTLGDTFKTTHVCGPICLLRYGGNEMPIQVATPPPEGPIQIVDPLAPELGAVIPTAFDEVRRG